MKEFIEKLIARLEEVSIPIFDEDTEMESKVIFTDIAKNIVNQLAEEYKGGWIPCSSGNFSTSEVLVCKEDGTIDFDVFDFMNEDWKFNSNHHKNKVLAWQPLPEPYKKGE